MRSHCLLGMLQYLLFFVFCLFVCLFTNLLPRSTVSLLIPVCVSSCFSVPVCLCVSSCIFLFLSLSLWVVCILFPSKTASPSSLYLIIINTFSHSFAASSPLRSSLLSSGEQCPSPRSFLPIVLSFQIPSFLTSTTCVLPRLCYHFYLRLYLRFCFLRLSSIQSSIVFFFFVSYNLLLWEVILSKCRLSLHFEYFCCLFFFF